MVFSLYDATVPVFMQMLGGLSGVIEKGRLHALEHGLTAETLLDARLAPDMFPFNMQVIQAVHQSAGSIEGVAAGQFSPTRTPPPDDFAGLKALVDEAIGKLKGLSPEYVNQLGGGDCDFVFGDIRLPFTSEDFLISFTMPNFFFHVTTAYNILRHQGVALGKRDFLGAPRLKT